MIDKWESSVRKYENWKDQKGEQPKLTGDLKMAAFESLLHYELGNHLGINKKRLNTFDAQEEEIEGIIKEVVKSNLHLQ